MERSSSEEKPAVSFEVEKNLPSLRLEVFDILRLIEDHVIPLLASKNRMVSHGNLVAGYADVEAVELRPALSLLFSLLCRPKVIHYLEGRAPPLELYLPVHQNTGGYYHQVRPPYSPLNCQMGQQGNRLNCFTQAHFVSQYAVHSLAMKSRHPVNTQQLVLPQWELY